jgi:hypothetical protein
MTPGIRMTRSESRPDWRWLWLGLLSVAGPPTLAISFLMLFGDVDRAAGLHGYAQANLHKVLLACFVLTLIALVAAVTWLARTPTARVLLMLIACAVSFLSFVMTFFSLMAP